VSEPEEPLEAEWLQAINPNEIMTLAENSTAFCMTDAMLSLFVVKG
jgi:hypothetical protein